MIILIDAEKSICKMKYISDKNSQQTGSKRKDAEFDKGHLKVFCN